MPTTLYEIMDLTLVTNSKQYNLLRCYVDVHVGIRLLSDRLFRVWP